MRSPAMLIIINLDQLVRYMQRKMGVLLMPITLFHAKEEVKGQEAAYDT